MKNEGTVYLFADTSNSSTYKIGVTRGDVGKRINELQTGNHEDIYVRKTYKSKFPFFIESFLHKKYSSKQVLNEWFQLTDEDVDGFEETCRKIEENIEALKDNPFFKYKKIK